MTVQIQNIWTKLEDMFDQIEKSWPKTMENILEKFDHGGEDFYVYTFFKWNTHIMPHQYNIYHQPRKTRPDAFPGTVLREISPSRGYAKIIWVLPHLEGFKLYESGKLFADEIVKKSIDMYKSGELNRWVEEQGDEWKKLD